MVWVLGYLIGFGLIGLGVWARRLSMMCQDWPKALGEILESRVDDFDRDHIRPIIVYRYWIKGEEFRSSRVSFADKSASRGTVEQWVAKYVPEQQVYVSYDPSKPQEAVLERAQTKNWHLWVTAGAACVGFATFFVILR